MTRQAQHHKRPNPERATYVKKKYKEKQVTHTKTQQEQGNPTHDTTRNNTTHDSETPT